MVSNRKTTCVVTLRLTSDTRRKLREYLYEMRKKGYRTDDALSLLLDAHGRTACQLAKPLL